MVDSGDPLPPQIRQVSPDHDPSEDRENGERDDAGGDQRERLIEGNGVPTELTEHRRPPAVKPLSRPPARPVRAVSSGSRSIETGPDRSSDKSPARSSSKAWPSPDGFA